MRFTSEEADKSFGKMPLIQGGLECVLSSIDMASGTMSAKGIPQLQAKCNHYLTKDMRSRLCRLHWWCRYTCFSTRASLCCSLSLNAVFDNPRMPLHLGEWNALFRIQNEQLRSN